MAAWIRLVLLLLFACTAPCVMAQSCVVNANSLQSANNYDPFSTAFNDSSGILSITCTRPTGGSGKFPSTFYAGVSNGSNWTGSTRQLRLGATGNYLSYALYRDYATCSQPWGSTSLSVVYSFPNSNTGPRDVTTSPNPLTSGTTYCFRITGGVATAPPGTYSDTVQVGVADSTGTTIYGQQSVVLSTTIVPHCVFTTAIPTLNLVYTSFQPGSASDSQSFQMKCTNTTSFSVGFDQSTASVLGLTYNLSSLPTTDVGSGTPATYSVTATIPGNQAGTCGTGSCTATSTRSVVVSY
jgi:hypothetical protein